MSSYSSNSDTRLASQFGDSDPQHSAGGEHAFKVAISKACFDAGEIGHASIKAILQVFADSFSLPSAPLHADDCQSHIVDVRGVPDDCTCALSGLTGSEAYTAEGKEELDTIYSPHPITAKGLS